MSSKIIKCKACGADIAKSAKVCPPCGAKHKKHPGLAVVAIIFGILLLASLFGEVDSLLPTADPIDKAGSRRI